MLYVLFQVLFPLVVTVIQGVAMGAGFAIGKTLMEGRKK